MTFHCEFERRNAADTRRLRHFEAMLVGPGLKPHVAPLRAAEARHDIGGDRFIGMADMRFAIGVGNRGGDIIGFGHANPLAVPS